jgi:hypothetical protein
MNKPHDARRRMLGFLLGAALSLTGCGGGGGEVDTVFEEGHQRMALAARLHQQFAMANRMRAPRNEEELKKFLKTLKKEQLEEMGVADAAQLLISPRDNEPYVFNWSAPGMAEMKMNKGGAGGFHWIAHEKTGVGGKRYIALNMGQIRLVDEENFRYFVK